MKEEHAEERGLEAKLRGSRSSQKDPEAKGAGWGNQRGAGGRIELVGCPGGGALPPAGPVFCCDPAVGQRGAGARHMF